MHEFTASVDALEKGFDGIITVLASSRKSMSTADLSRIVAEQFAASVAIKWENFIHDVLVAHVLRSHRKYLKGLEKDVVKLVSEKFGIQCSKGLILRFGTPSSVRDIEPLLNPKGRNITASSGDNLASTANRLLTSSLARKFSLDQEDRIFVDVLLAVRNFLAHRSSAARAALIQAIRRASPVGKNAKLYVSSIQLAEYLSGGCQTGERRIKVMFQRVKEIALQFR